MTKELPKAYEPKKYEYAIYKRWEESSFFNPDNLDGEPYSIMMPPPNVTGVLHLGHALENTLMDIMARYQRMNGKKVMIVPGTDHAAVATQAKVEKLLVEEGMKHPREELGRERLLEKIRDYAEDSKSTILSQIRKMGTSCDWSRLAYTFDEQRNDAVNEMFKRMYDDGLIYRGDRVINWSVKGQSTCSDDELVHVERPGKMYTFKYNKEFPITIASTRPETKLGDTAVAVHPDDKRYKKFIGKTFTVDVGAAKPLELKVIANENVDPEFGTGALGVTPAHSQIDFEMYEMQKAASDPIGLIQVIGEDGRMTEAAGEKYAGLPAEDARERFAQWLRDEGLMENEEDITQNVGTSDRFKDVVEAIPKRQWFVAVNKEVPGRGKSLKDLMKDAVTTGHNGKKDQKVTITPERFEKMYFNWIDNLRDWCISRQIWWGHRIPVWYCIPCHDDLQKHAKGEYWMVGVEKPATCPRCGVDSMHQDNDTLDTWFSSGTWTFSTLGWPNKTDDLKTFHPTSWMQMGHEILFFWMARMILMSTYALDEIPFKDVYIHGLLRNEQGKKFSKSDGNNADPLDIIAQYGADALRYSVVAGISPGNDSRFYKEKIEGARNLVTKLWNMSRFMVMNIEGSKVDCERPEPKTLADEWILAELDGTTRDIGKAIDSYDFSAAAERLRDFTWGTLADWYLEIAKIEGGKSAILNYILNTLLKLWHPYMPFVTEAIWQEVYGEETMLMVATWPTSGKTKDTPDFDMIKDIVTGIRSVRAQYNIAPKNEITATICAGKKESFLDENQALITGLCRVGTLTFSDDKPETSAGFVVAGMQVYVDLGGAVDINKEKARLQKEIDSVAPYVASQEKKLANKGFVDNAPADILDGEKKKLAEAQEKLSKLNDQLASLS